MLIVRMAVRDIEGLAGYPGSGEKRKEKQVIVKRRRDPNWKIGWLTNPLFGSPCRNGRPCYGYDDSLHWQKSVVGYPQRYGAKPTDGGLCQPFERHRIDT